MEQPSSSTTSPKPPAALRHIVCGVGGGRRDTVAIEQALRLAGDGRVSFVTIAHVVGSGTTAQASLGRSRARRALDRARDIARERGAVADTILWHGADPAAALLEQADGADLLVVGAPLTSRAGGIAEGATSTDLAHRATLPVLLAREAEEFPRRILVATDGSAGSEHAIDLAVAIAPAHEAEVTVVHVNASTDTELDRMLGQARRIADATGREPVWTVPTGRPVNGICAAAEWKQASLVILGARGVTGLRALGSVSERVAHEAPCSVLIARG